MVQIHDTLTRHTKEFVPLDPQGRKVRMYTCGVTVYDDCHIGHARSLYIFDVIRRYLKYRGYDVTLVRNITDIDDKIINRANELKVNWKELVEKYIANYYEDIKALGVEKADFEPRATENIPDMIAYIQKLIDKGFAYATSTGVYFSVRKFTEYGKLSGQGIEQMLTGVRKAADETKEDPLDFALWKLSKAEEPSWPSPWGQGRPGWHIECSVMSQKYLKTETLDVHAGGRDLVFPHHENEIAQAEALTGKPFAKYWIHHGLLTINEQKMSKSLGNFITIKDFIAKYKNVNVLKLFFLSAHYAHPIDYNDKKIEEEKQAYEKLTNLFEQFEKKQIGSLSTTRSRNPQEIEDIKTEFINAMDEDFNTPQGCATIFSLVKAANNNIEDTEFLISARALLIELLGIFRISIIQNLSATLSGAGDLSASLVDKIGVSDDMEAKIKALIDGRNKAREKKDFKTADKIRRELEEQGFILMDNKDGTVTLRKKS